MKPIGLIAATLAGWLVCMQSALAIDPVLPVEDGGLLQVAALGLIAVIAIARTKNRR